ncbi:NACHT domain-containing protein [Agromyces sp. NPDC057679]|uniref:NACHT domain-containing protein n=1 Tax=Agromyces sp. NPDC057679 TaxID=3346207 RepID=UPI003672B02F
MDYDLSTLGPANFEHLTQALVAGVVNSSLSVFGVGPDGGREATWSGPTALSGTELDGLGVLQAKYRLHEKEPIDNLRWLKKQISAEIKRWAQPTSKRKAIPRFLLFATNVRLSPRDGGGKELIEEFALNQIRKRKLPIEVVKTWEYDEIRTYLDGADAVRRRYQAFITPGDVVASLLDQRDSREQALAEALSLSLARALGDDDALNLTQAGTVSDQRVSVTTTFVDLPAVDRSAWHGQIVRSGDEGFQIAKTLLREFGRSNPLAGGTDESKPPLRKVVLVGGPGQGKSTITQWLAQVYRAEFLRESPVVRNPELAAIVASIERRLAEIGLDRPRSRPWPFRVILTALADYLSENPERTLLDFIAASVSRRSSVIVDGSDMRGWLRKYPWVLFVDGLDEVPASSNRAEVLECLADFYLEAEMLGADLITMATTRPQGYSAEFSPKVFRHFELVPLDVDQALAYAAGLVAVRTGVGTQQSEKTMERLERASREDFTARLFQSPLQVTILTVLLEKIGKAPRDRWRLFSAYYSVISQREQEKGGPLAELLQTYETDVSQLHRSIGHLLQKRGAGPGDTSSYLTAPEFEGLIADHFESQGHSEQEVERLRDDFATLVTDRLVFLTRLNAERIGFELRSLQEFMAGEYIVNLPESKVISAIEEIARSAYWRNVTLFAIGCIFATRAHLRSDVSILCADLNRHSHVFKVTKPGSYLALDVLHDGAAASQPMHARTLAATVAELIDGPFESDLARVGDLGDNESTRVLLDRAASASPAGTSTWLNRAMVLNALDAVNELESIANHSPARAKRPLGALTMIEPSLGRSSTIAGFSRSCDPLSGQAMGHLPMRVALQDDLNSENGLPWALALPVLAGFAVRRNVSISVQLDSGSTVRLGQFMGVRQDDTVWRSLTSVEPQTPELGSVRALSRFVVSPTRDTLAAALDALSEADWYQNISISGVPWVVHACLNDAAILARRQEHTRGERLQQLARYARRGLLGDQADWLEAEERFSSPLSVHELGEDLVEDPEVPDWGLPISSSIGRRGIVLPASLLLGRYRPQPDTASLKDLLANVRVAFDSAKTVNSRAQLWRLAATIPTSIDEMRAGERVIDFDVDWLLSDEAAVWAYSAPLDWIGCLSDGVDLGAFAVTVGRNPQLPYGHDSEIAARLLEAGSPIEYWPSLRVALRLDPSMLATLDGGFPSGRSVQADDPLARQLESLRTVMSTSLDDIGSGEVDSQLLDICTPSENSIGPEWLSTAAGSLALDRCLAILARAAVITMDDHPFASEMYMSTAQSEELHREFGVSLR